MEIASIPGRAAIATVFERRLEKTRALKQGMMQERLTGRIRLP